MHVSRIGDFADCNRNRGNAWDFAINVNDRDCAAMERELRE